MTKFQNGLELDSGERIEFDDLTTQDSAAYTKAESDSNYIKVFDADCNGDHTYSGIVATMTVDANSTGFGAALYIASDGNLEEADASSEDTMPCFGLACETGTGSKIILLKGFIRDDSWDWTPGKNIYVSETTGALTQVQPTTINAIAQKVGQATHADRIYFDCRYEGTIVGTIALQSIGAFAGGHDDSNWLDSIDYITLNSTCNASDYGNLTVDRWRLYGTSNGINDRGIFGSGYTSVYVNVIDYIRISTGNVAADFGDYALISAYSSTSNKTNERGIFAGGQSGVSTWSLGIYYVTINSPGNATTFGNLTQARSFLGATSNGVNDRGIFSGGYEGVGSQYNIIDYITISSTGNATDFGDCPTTYGYTNISNDVNERGLLCYAGNIHYVTINSTGNSTSFGSLSVGRNYHGGVSNAVNERGIFAGGIDGSSYNTIDYVTINITGNATDFGDLNTAKNQFGSAANI